MTGENTAKSFLLITALAGGAFTIHAQRIKIVVVDASRGKPVTDECLNVSLGQWHGADLLVPTDKDGVATLIFETNQVSIVPVLGRTCNGMVSTKPLPIASGTETISVVTNYYVSCQYSNKLVKDPDWLKASPAQRIPVFTLHEIIARGIVATNSCSKFARAPQPGELLLVVRKRTFLEGMRS
ncbi:hypothetical protein [Terriglobus sp.]|uniref:hypothetical protein n=1 Tax=Terriglobus sp. TaxID=1889013 RepID=UPI003AFFDF96